MDTKVSQLACGLRWVLIAASTRPSRGGGVGGDQVPADKKQHDQNGRGSAWESGVHVWRDTHTRMHVHDNIHLQNMRGWSTSGITQREWKGACHR